MSTDTSGVEQAGRPPSEQSEQAYLQPYTRSGADYPYRLMVEAMSEGALILESDRTILYANLGFAAAVGVPLDELTGSLLDRFVPAEELPRYEALLRRVGNGTARGELTLAAKGGRAVPVHVSIISFEAGTPHRVAVVTDLTEHTRHLDLIAAEALQRAKRAEAEEGHRRTYFDLGLIGMAITSPSKHYIEVNDELCRILGCEREQLLRETWADMTHPADLAADVVQFDRVMAGEIDGYSIDKRWRRKDGRIVDSMMASRCVRRTDGSVEYFVGLVQDTTQRKHDDAERQDLIRRLMTAQENERRRIALEMHDQFGQQLTTLMLKLAALRGRSGRRTTLSEELTQLETIVRQLDTDLDLLVSRLRPPSLDDLGLIAAVDDYVRQWSERVDVHAELHASGIEDDCLTGEIETTLYRVVLEALNNVAKHAHAMNVAVLLDRGVARVSLIIEDDGVGFDVEQQSHSHQRFGVTGMRERATLLGGTFDIESRPGNGTTIALRIPLPHAEDTRK